jgi:adenylate cyclase
VLNPNLATAWHFSGNVLCWLGRPEEAIEHFARAMRLSPLDPLLGQMHTGTAFAHFSAGRHEEAVSWAEQAVREAPAWVPAYIAAAASNALTGRIKEARQVVAKLRELDSGHCIATLKNIYPLRRPEDLAKLEQGLRRAGLPE